MEVVSLLLKATLCALLMPLSGTSAPSASVNIGLMSVTAAASRSRKQTRGKVKERGKRRERAKERAKRVDVELRLRGGGSDLHRSKKMVLNAVPSQHCRIQLIVVLMIASYCDLARVYITLPRLRNFLSELQLFMVMAIVQCELKNLVMTMVLKVIVTLVIITCILAMLLGVVPGFRKCLQHVVKIAGMKLCSGHVLKLLEIILMMMMSRARSCQTTKVSQTTLMMRTPPTSQRTTNKKRYVAGLAWSAVSC